MLKYIFNNIKTSLTNFKMNDLDKYVRFCHLGKYDDVFIHSKMMIFDDDYLILSSSNIADRSYNKMYHDNETAIAITNKKYVKNIQQKIWNSHMSTSNIVYKFNQIFYSSCKNKKNQINCRYSEIKVNLFSFHVCYFFKKIIDIFAYGYIL
jgi:phosphatidylserine/phosphatidylglycerophosphate/cardiolipin synthase-like enzyme